MRDIEDLELDWDDAYDALVRDDVPRAVYDGAVDAMGEFERNHPYQDRTHNLTDSAWVRIHHVNDRGTLAELRWPAQYASYVDEGTRPHKIRAKTAQALHFVNAAGDDVFAREVNHPGTKPRPFVQKTADRASELIEHNVNLALDAALRRVGAA